MNKFLAFCGTDYKKGCLFSLQYTQTQAAGLMQWVPELLPSCYDTLQTANDCECLVSGP